MLSKERQLYFWSILAPRIKKRFLISNFEEKEFWFRIEVNAKHLVNRYVFVYVDCISDVLEWQHDLHLHFSERTVFLIIEGERMM